MARVDLEDVVIEIGDRLWNRRGRLWTFDNLKMTHRACSAGTGQVDIPGPTDAVRKLLVRGATITVTLHGKVLQSGCLTSIGETKDDLGQVVCQLSWEDTLAAYLGHELLYPNPKGPARTDGQGAFAKDQRSGYTTSVILGYVFDNVGAGAWQPRQAPGLVVAEDPLEGVYLPDPVGARYDPALDFLRQTALVNGCVFWIETIDRTHYFRCRQVRDLSRNVVFSDKLNNLGAGSWKIDAPKQTRIMMLGPGDDTDQIVIELTGAEAEAQEQVWGHVFRGVYTSQTVVNDPVLSDYAKFRTDELGLAQTSLDNAERNRVSAAKDLSDALAAVPQVPADIAAAQTANTAAHALSVEARNTFDTATTNKVAADTASAQRNLALTVAAMDVAARQQLADQGETISAEYQILEGTFDLGVQANIGDIVALIPDGAPEPFLKPLRELTETFSVANGRKRTIIAGDYGSTSGTQGAFTTRELIATVNRLRTRS